MELIIGGRAQGKLEYTLNISGLSLEHVLTEENQYIKKQMNQDTISKDSHQQEVKLQKRKQKVLNEASSMNIDELQKANGVILPHLETLIYCWMKEIPETEQMFTPSEALYRVKAYIQNTTGNIPRNCYIISDEVGLGLVPCDAFEREYREMVGRVLCLLVKECNRVHRVFCGIGVILQDLEEKKEK